MLTEEHALHLPHRPDDLAALPVASWRAPLTLPTYLPLPPSDLPAYLDRRVYQGSSGRVYPLPFHERVAAEPTEHAWDAVHLENEWIRLVVLPELGGRIHLAVERSTGADLFYGNPVIKPALVGLAGPWLAGGIELNWPQHHRPATFLPTDVQVETEDDGSVTVWCSDHDPFERMKGMHGVRLRPGCSAIELRVRLYNRTPLTQTFLWWANVAARAGADYQSFFPADVRLVADHAKRAVVGFPAADRRYYDIDYPARRDRTFTAADGSEVAGDRLDWYRNIPVPTSYMVTESEHDFFGGYDHATGVGFVHVADRRLAVGKKQWTWGDSDFGRAWGANLADDGSAYVELMAGVFTDNQPDFAFLAPGETKVFSQSWYPLLRIGPVHEATDDAAVRVDVDGARIAVGVVTTRSRPGTRVEVLGDDGATLLSHEADVDPATPLSWQAVLPSTGHGERLTVRVLHGGAELVRYRRGATPDRPDHDPATEPPAPADVGTVEELVEVAGHLEQYRHATRSPEPYWAEALRRDPGSAAAHTAVGLRRLRQARLVEAERHLRAAVDRLTRYHPTPPDATALYHLGLVLAAAGRPAQAYDAFGRASWDRAWRAPAGYQMARLDAAAGRDRAGLHRLADVLRTEPEHLQAHALRALLLERTGDVAGARAALAAAGRIDPLHWWARHLAGEPLGCDAQTCLDVALEHAAVGELPRALAALDAAREREQHRPLGQTAAGPLIELHRAALLARLGDGDGEASALAAARGADRARCFPGRLQDALMLERTLRRHPDEAVAHALLGHWYHAAGRPEDALTRWQQAAALDGGDAVVHRNVGLALVGSAGDLDGARAAYDAALRVAPGNARLLFESDQLDRRRAVPVRARLAALERAADLVRARDDLTVELAHLLVTAGRAAEAYRLLAGRRFQPWEGGEGEVLRAWERTCVTLARTALAAADVTSAGARVTEALHPPASLGEARHPLATTARLQLLAGDVADRDGRPADAAAAWRLAAAQVGDFRTMSAHRHSEASYSSVLALRRLGHGDAASRLAADLAAWVDELEAEPARIDYFATSLPQLLLFPPDLQQEKAWRVRFLRAQLDALDGDVVSAVARLDALLGEVPDHPDAHDLITTLREDRP